MGNVPLPRTSYEALGYAPINCRQIRERNRTVEKTNCPVAKRPDPGRHGEPQDPVKVLEVNWHYKTLQHSLRTKEKEDEPKGDKDDKSGSGKRKSQHTGPSAELLLNKVGYKVLHKHNKTKPGFCFPFQSGSCAKLDCRQHHNCAGCGKVGVPYNDCLCLAHPLNRDLN